MSNIFGQIREELQLQKRSLDTLKNDIAEIDASDFQPHTFPLKELSHDMSPQEITDHINGGSNKEIAASQISMVAQLVLKLNYALAIIEFQTALREKTTDQKDLGEIGDCLERDEDEFPKLMYQFARAAEEHRNNRFADLRLSDESLKNTRNSMQARFEEIRHGNLMEIVRDKTSEEIISRIGELRLKYASMCIKETQLYLEDISLKTREALFVKKVWDEGMSPRISREWLEDRAQSHIDEAKRIVPKCEERLTSLKKFMSSVYEMTTSDNADNFTADRYHAASLDMISKFTP